jgi:Predicted membrane protein (DUF2142)
VPLRAPAADTAGEAYTGEQPRRPLFDRGGRRFFMTSWLLVSLLSAAWALATPLFASPDEPGQVVKAVAVARGQLTGETLEQPSGQYFRILTEVDAPAYYADAFDATACFIDDPGEAADCAQEFRADDTSSAELTTWIGRYPPVYYFVTGLPSLVVDGEAAVLAMRVVSAVLCSFFFALGLTSLRSTSRPTAFLGAGLLAVTPTALFYGGVVNSSGLEIAAGFATWAVLLPVVLEPTAVRSAPRLLLGAATAAVLLNTRPGSPLLAALIAACLAVAATRTFWREALGGRRWLAPVLVATVGALVAAAWLLAVEPTAGLGGEPDPALADPARVIAGAWDLTPRYLREQLAVFGLLNVPAHPAVLWLLGLTIGALVLAGVIVARGRLRASLVLTAVLVIVLPLVAQIPTAAELGLIWQGRYGLPFAIGLPVVAMAAVLSRDRSAAVAGRLVPVLVTVAALCHVGSFVWALWRYSWGFGHWPLADPLQWQPPLGVVPLVAVVAVAVLALGALVLSQEDSVVRRVIRPVTGRPVLEPAGRSTT